MRRRTGTYLFIAAILSFLSLIYFKTIKTIEEKASSCKNSADSLKVSYVKVSCVGDVFLHDSNIESAERSGGYSFEGIFDEVAGVLSNADIASCWLGGVFDSLGPYKGYPLFKSPPQILDVLKESGFDLMLRTNHTMDYGREGLETTTEEIRRRGLLQLGAFLTENESRRIFVLTKDSLSVAFLSYTYGLNGMPTENGWEVALIDTAKIGEDIRSADALSDFVVVFLHYGTEYSIEPSAYQKRIARFCAEAGAGIIIGSHPHVIEPVDTIITKDGRLVYSAYSLGNFYCGQRKERTESGMILSFIIEKSNRTKFNAEVKSVSYKPTYVRKFVNEEGNVKFKVVFSESFTDSSDIEEYRRVKDSVIQTKELMSIISDRL